MGYRRSLVEELVRHVLGPLGGPREELDGQLTSPADLYMTGVLETPASGVGGNTKREQEVQELPGFR